MIIKNKIKKNIGLRIVNTLPKIVWTINIPASYSVGIPLLMYQEKINFKKALKEMNKSTKEILSKKI